MPNTVSDVEHTSNGGVPPYDPLAVGRVAKLIEIRNVELVHAHFEREDEGPLSAHGSMPEATTPEVLLDLEWELDRDRQVVGYLLRFGVQQAEPQFRVFAFFRVTYDLTADEDIQESDLAQFGYWNAIFNGWPYFREFVSSTINRAGLPRATLPVMRLPRRED